MLETGTTGEMQQHYQRAHALRAAAFGTAFMWLARVARVKKGPRQTARPLGNVACA